MKVFAKISGKVGMERVEMTDPLLNGIVFVFDDGQEFDVKGSKGCLNVRTTNGTLVIVPEATNSIVLTELLE